MSLENNKDKTQLLNGLETKSGKSIFKIFEFEDYLAMLEKNLCPQGICASAGPLFSGGIFGRDSLIAAKDILPFLPKITRKAILSLAKYQGIEENPNLEESPGKIPHEIRLADSVNPNQIGLYNNLVKIWGKPKWLKEDAMVYYGTLDATLRYIILIEDFCNQYGPEILEEKIEHKSGRFFTLKESLFQALNWVLNQIEPESGFFVCERRNELGPVFPVLRDGAVSYINTEGKLPNHKEPLIFLDVQILTVEALISGAKLSRKLNFMTNLKLEEMANKVLKNILDKFWLEEKKYFGAVIERNEEGLFACLEVETSIPAEIYDSVIPNLISRNERKKYLIPIAQKMYSGDFLTPVGIRMRSLTHAGLIPYWDYQGAMTVWPVITCSLANGFFRHGEFDLAHDLWNRTLNGFQCSGEAYEFFYVDEFSTPNFDPQEQAQRKDRRIIPATNRPEGGQTWSITAALRAHYLIKNKPVNKLTLSGLEELQEIATNQATTKLIRDIPGLIQNWKTEPGIGIDLQLGEQLERDLVRKSLSDMIILDLNGSLALASS